MLQRSSKPSISVLSMYGMGDCIVQRAVVRELMKTRSVELLTYYTAMYHDLIAEGLKVTLVSGHLDPGSATRAMARGGKAGRQHDRKIGYDHAQTKKHGTLLAAMFGSVGLKCPDRPTSPCRSSRNGGKQRASWSATPAASRS
jgi:hypothetical protein